MSNRFEHRTNEPQQLRLWAPRPEDRPETWEASSTETGEARKIVIDLAEEEADDASDRLIIIDL